MIITSQNSSFQDRSVDPAIELKRAVEDWEKAKATVQALSDDTALSDRISVLKRFEYTQMRVAEQAKRWIEKQNQPLR